MKKSLILALSLAAPVFAGDVTLAPPTVITPTPAPACCPLSVEVGGVYGFASGDIYDGVNSKDIDVYGADITAVYTLSDKHSVNLRLGYTYGSEQHPIFRNYGCKWEQEIQTISLMPGYRYTHAINEKWSVFAGANAGIAQVSVKDSVSGAGEHIKDQDSDWGFAWSLEVGAKYKMSDSWYAYGTYGLFGNTAEPALYNGEAAVDQQWYQGIRLGIGCEF